MSVKFTQYGKYLSKWTVSALMLFLFCRGIYQAPINRSGSAYEYRRFDTGNMSQLNGISMYKSSNYYTGEFGKLISSVVP